MSDYRRRPCGHLVRLALNRNGNIPNFALLLGAGASVSSRVDTGEDLVDRWREEAYRNSGSALSLSDWLGQQAWYGTDEEYAVLFERVYDQPAQRRVFVEECVKDAKPNWGYVYLTSLLLNRVFDVVFTTNFDDLINEACFLYSDGLRPIVAAHDSSISSVRLTAGRPKIIKLHGDFLYDNVKNTVRELESLETNTKKKIAQFAQEYGLIVCGYGGHDRTVMDTLEVLLRSEGYFPHGIYWCVRPGTKISERLSSLLHRDNVFLVETEGFDQLMAEIQIAGGFGLPEPIAAPLKVARNRAQLFVDVGDTLRQHKGIADDIQKVLQQIDLATSAETVPTEMRAAAAEARNDFALAARLWQAALREGQAVGKRLIEALFKLEKWDEAVNVAIADGSLRLSEKLYFVLRAGHNEKVIEMSEGMHFRKDFDGKLVRINRAIAYKRLGRPAEMNAEIELVETNNPKASVLHPFLAAGISALRGDRAGTISHTADAIAQHLLTWKSFDVFPVFEDVSKDEEIRKEIAKAVGVKEPKTLEDLTSAIARVFSPEMLGAAKAGGVDESNESAESARPKDDAATKAEPDTKKDEHGESASAQGEDASAAPDGSSDRKGDPPIVH